MEPGVLRVTSHGSGGTLTGTGIVVRSDQTGSYVLTAAYLVRGTKVTQIVLTALNGKRHFITAAVAIQHDTVNSSGDLALIRLLPTQMHVLAWGNSNQLEIGQTVLSITTGQGSAAPRVGVDTITTLRLDRKDGLGHVWILHGTPLKQSAPEGPLFSRTGAIVGINVVQKDGLGFLALPAAQAKAVTTTLMATLSASQPTAVSARATALATHVATASPTSTRVPLTSAMPTATVAPQAAASARL